MLASFPLIKKVSAIVKIRDADLSLIDNRNIYAINGSAFCIYLRNETTIKLDLGQI